MRAIANLIDNAARYGGTAEVSLTQEPWFAVITVADEGPGLPEDQLEAVFEPFVRLEGSRNRDTGGVGLGLAIARTIIQAHGGTIQFVNRTGGGSSTRRAPGWFVGRSGSIAVHARSESQNPTVIAHLPCTTRGK